MHLVKARPNPGLAQHQEITSGSGLNQLAAAASEPRSNKSASQRSVPPSTRAFAKDFANFYGAGELSSKAYAQARAIKHGESKASDSNQPPSTRQFANAYQAFFDVPEVNDNAMKKVRALKNGEPVHSRRARGSSFRISTGVRDDPNFKANAARFHGTQGSEQDEMYKNYRAFYGGATPNVNQAGHMGKQLQEQQKTLLRNKLAENAKRILNTKSFSDGLEIVQTKPPSQQQVLKESGFAAPEINKATEEPASYQVLKPSGSATFKYERNPKIDKVTKCDPPLKNLDKKVRYNIITGSLQPWF